MKLNSKIIITLIAFCLSFSGLNALSPGKSFIRSLVIPGWGELSQGDNSGYAFIASELIIWSSILYFKQEAKNQENKAYNYAVNNAGIPIGNHSEDYLDLIGKYNSSGFEAGGYGDYLLRVEQASGTGNPNAVVEDNVYINNMPWNWGTTAKRGKYKQMRKDADYNRDWAKSLAGAVILNHILSGANSIRISKKQKRLKLNAGLLPDSTVGIFASYNF